MFAVGPCPVIQEVSRDVGDSEAASLAPQGDALTDLIDELVRLNALGVPVGRERELRAAFLGRWDRNEVGTDSPARDDLVRDAILAEPEMVSRLDVCRV